jgi:hypothetical protein
MHVDELLKRTHMKSVNDLIQSGRGKK